MTLSKTRREIVVTFRGTMNIWNVIFDFTAYTVTYPKVPGGIKIHAGFLAAVNSLYVDVS